MYLLQSISQYVLVWYVQLSEALNLLISPKTEKLDAIGINLHYEPVDLSIIIKANFIIAPLVVSEKDYGRNTKISLKTQLFAK